MKNRFVISLAGVAIALVLLVAINLLGNVVLGGARVDLTENKLFTLADGTKKVLSQLDEPVKLEFFRSRKEAEKYIGAYSRRIEEFLREYETESHGKLKVEVLDPEPYSETEERAIQAGLKAAGGPPLSADESLYFGIVGSNTVGDSRTIPFLTPARETFLEYDLSKLVYDLAHPKKTVVGVLSSLPIEGAANPFEMRRDAPQPWMIVDQIREFYEVRTIQPNATSIPSDVEVLMLVHPKGLSDSLQFAIDQFVLKGGKALVFADPWCDADQPMQDPNNPLQAMMAPRNSEIEKLFTAWGVSMPKDKLAADRKFATPVNWNNRGQYQQIAFVVWLTETQESFNDKEVATNQLKSVMFKYPGFLEVKDGATTTFTPLIQTSEESMEIPTSSIQFQPDPPKLLAEFMPSGKKMTLAARLSGKAKTAFPDGKPAGADGADTSASESGEALKEGDINVVVFADADMLEDHSWVQVMNIIGSRMPMKTADNGDLVMNLLDFMRGSTDLVTLRARGSSAYPMLVVDELKRQAEQNLRSEEQKLVDEKERVERELSDLLSKSGDNAEQVLMSAEVQGKVDDLRKSLVDTNKRLREVRYNLNKDVEWLGTKLKLINIVLVPLLVIVAALVMFLLRANRRKLA